MHFSSSCGVATVFALLLTATGALSDQNKLFISQDSSLAGATGNSLFVDQSLANGSLISGSLGSNTPATQRGGSNQAEIRVSSGDGTVALNQTNLGGAANTANVNLGGLLATGILSQNGFGNEGSLTVSGYEASGALVQDGNENLGYVSVNGVGASGTLTQKGNNNNTSLDVSGNGTTVNLTQVGNNINSSPTVRSNGGTVTITQSN